MGRITSNVGLITGIPITDTVDQLIAVAGAPRDLLLSRTQGLQQQQLAINTLSTRLLSLKFELNKLKVADPYEARTVTSQDKETLTATLANNGKPAFGTYQVRPAQTATAQQLISQRFEDLDDIQNTGTLSFGFGGFVDEGRSLSELNSGAGVARGQIKIIDRSGTSAVIDLSLAQTVDDVIEKINAETTINVTASTDGDSFKLTDTVGGAGAITVQEVAGGTTAADLGLDDGSITKNGSTATGADIFALYTGTKLTRLNDGNGVQIRDAVDDLQFDLIDGTQLTLDLDDAATLGDVIDKINALDAAKLTAAIASDGKRIELHDLTSGGGAFSVSSVDTGTAAEDLGLTEAAVGADITGRRLVAGLRDTLLSSFNGGAGVGTLGDIDITDRLGTPAVTVDLSSAETLGDIVKLINDSSADVTAAINSARSGITITDNSGGTGDFIIADSGATTTATNLKIAVNDQVASVNSGKLHRQTISEATLLADLKGGLGIVASDVKITDSNGVSTSIDLNKKGAEAKTIGDVIDAINASSVGVEASINSTGDGILITDTALGSKTLGISDTNGTLAADLNLTRASKTIDINGQDTQVIDGSNAYSVDLSDVDGSPDSISLSSLNGGAGIDDSDILITDSAGKTFALDFNGVDAGISTVGQLIDRINERATSAGAGVTASINSAGTGILLTDTAEGSGNLKVEDVNGTAAADLKILSNDNTTTEINGSGLFSAQSASQGALDTVASRINDLDAGVTASTFFDGVGYRLSLVVDQTGAANEIALDAEDSGFSFTVTSKARDALLVLGEQQVAGSGILISSPDNSFGEVIDGVDLTVVKASETAIDVTVASTDATFVKNIESFVSAYNAIRSELDELTDFDDTDYTTGLLFGTNEALRVDTELSRLITDRYRGVGSFESLEEIGLSVDDEGKLQLNKSELKEAFADNPNGLKSFFTDETNGLVTKFNRAIESLAGADNGLLGNRNDSLQATIDINQQRIDRFNESLDRQREALLLQFYQLEQIIANLQQSRTALDSLQPLAPLAISSRN
ncbi:MAG: flagellar filament capping protein FliD [Planctomycetales bacterium]|nr:flagellar filament capping protein FliD [Planctomycetales bacterium]